MVVECLAIVVIIGAVAFAYLRTGKKEYAAIVATLLLLPGAHLGIEVFGKTALSRLEMGGAIMVMADALLMGITYLLIGRLSRHIEGRGQRMGVMFVTCLYSVVLTAIFIFDTLGG